ncbi:MAG: phosphocarrier protein HPr [Elusimicrobia bacterium GWC2_51_8]|nr:MAG: phosphocarrier protein HPr [Elusimicrobia bacterium GWA2_51_34]OGR64261.1 MAG: phosphocarrier protein HPr [Elusimicrobia bacterium GWC2_51_8]HAF96012.1 phosphocarrier protein HPr [Elusimicrobiota bacterium]HCE96990.1 phosphocarrier protein HPr [Elusimicrobiota bacterium]
MIKKNIRVINELGIHARPAGMLADTASKFTCDLKLIKDKMEVNCKSIMGILTLAAGFGVTLTVVASGKDEAAAVAAIERLFAGKFEEE